MLTLVPHELASLLQASCSLTMGRKVTQQLPHACRMSETPTHLCLLEPSELLCGADPSPPPRQEHKGSGGTHGVHKPTGQERKEGLNWGHQTPVGLWLQSHSC